MKKKDLMNEHLQRLEADRVVSLEYQGAVMAYCAIGFISYMEAMKRIERYANAAPGRYNEED